MGDGGLYDNIQAPLTARFWKNINIGWAGANTVFWNCEGDFLVQKPPTAQNYSFGHIGVNAVVFNIPLQDTTKENGHIESLDRHVTPRSLYLTQLRERLGEAAVRNIAAPEPARLNRHRLRRRADAIVCRTERSVDTSSVSGGYVARRRISVPPQEALGGAATPRAPRASAESARTAVRVPGVGDRPGHAQGLGRHAEGDEGVTGIPTST